MTSISSEHVFYAFSPDIKPAARVPLGEKVTLETKDCFSNQLQQPTDEIDTLDWNHINPATGPLYLEGVEAGDLVRIDVLEVTPEDQSVMACIPGAGALGTHITKHQTVILHNDADNVVIPTSKGEVAIPAHPMVGVMGLAPTTGSIPTGEPGEHGGNMDCTLMVKGASLYLKAAVAGGLFGCGDIHTVMGDGEVLVCGAEAAGKVTVAADIVEQPKLPVPFLENADIYATIASAVTLDEAAQKATNDMLMFLTEIVGLSINEAGCLMSAVGYVKVCQIVNPKKTARFEFPKKIVHELGFAGL